MSGNARVLRALRLAPIALFPILPILTAASASSQTAGLEVSTLRDPNIFDIYFPTPDRISQLHLEASEEWEFDQASLSASYDGALQIFSDLPARNYHLHLLSFEALYHFEAADDGESEADSGSPPPPETAPAHSDSSDRFLRAAVSGASQFDKSEFTEFGNPATYDNSAVEATLEFRQPLFPGFALRPSYTFSGRVYPQVSAVSNIQHIFGLGLGTDLLKGSWIAAAAGFAFKSYTGSSSFTDTVTFRNSSGHGKGFGSGNGGVRARTVVFATPSVKQFTLSIAWKQEFSGGTTLTAAYARFGAPSGAARIIPQQLRENSEGGGALGEFASRNEIFDDHFAYAGDAASLELRQSLPLGVLLSARERLEARSYTVPALDLSDSVTLATRRSDHRSETVVALSRSIPLGEGRTLRPEMEFHYVRNDSNAPYYEFDKSVVLLGLAFGF